MFDRNTLYFGDNLVWLRDHDEFPNECVDLVYLDPPFNSKADYNMIFKEPGGKDSAAQTKAFDDTWGWEKDAAEEALQELAQHEPDVEELIRWVAKRGDRQSRSTAAYLAMMAPRLVELHRVLKPTGSLYLHCDPTASHYLKLVLDTIFGVANFRNEISWRRSNPKSLNRVNFPNCRDLILRYSKSDKVCFNKVFGEHDPDYVAKAYHYTDSDGRRYRLLPLLNPNDDRPNLTYEFLGVRRVWRWTKERMQKAYEEGLVVQLKPGAVPQYKLYLHESRGRSITDDWSDIQQVAGKERLPYPTQKPQALLERIISASSNPGDVILDPFCGCGTAVAAAQQLGRRWVGIDVTWLAVDLIAQRLAKQFGDAIRKTYAVKGAPYDTASARSLFERSPKQFELWAISLVGAAPRERDAGVDGLLSIPQGGGKGVKVVVQVKGGRHLNPGMMRDLKGTIEHEKAAMGLMITLETPTSGMVELATHSPQYTPPGIGQSYPTLQIRTVDDLLHGKGFSLPAVVNPLKQAAYAGDAQKGSQLGLHEARGAEKEE